MSELIFLVEEDASGGFTARALGASIFTEAENKEQLQANIREAISSHYDDPAAAPKVIRLHFVRDEVFAL
jgi:hypothetical protein